MKPTKEMLAVAPNVPDAESVNKQLLDTLRRARKYVFSCAPQGGLLIAIDGAISAAEQRQTEPSPELTDEEILTAFKATVRVPHIAGLYKLEFARANPAAILALLAERDALIARAESAERDAELLGFIEANPEYYLRQSKRHWWFSKGQYPTEGYKTMREAISAAMENEKC